MSGLRLKTGVSVWVLAVTAFATAQAAEKPKVKPLPDPKAEVLKDGKTAYGASGAQGVLVPPKAVKTEDMPDLKAYHKDARDAGCPDGTIKGEHVAALPERVVKEARPGQCYTRLLKPHVFETYMDQEVIAAARTETRVIPEQSRMVERKVLVTPERVERKVIPAVTRTVMAEEVVEEAYSREEVVPAVYERRIEHVLVKPARKEWVRSEGIATGAALVTPVDHKPVPYRADGRLTWPGKTPISSSPETTEYLQSGSAQDVWCLKEFPAEYQPMERQVEIHPQTVRRVHVPAKIRKVKRTIVDREEQVVEKVIPAVYKVERVKEILSEARTETIDVPPVYRPIEKTRTIKPAEPVWREVLCEKNATPEKIRQVQKALSLKGYDPGPIDGRLGVKTVAAMQKFQADNGLAQGQISVEAAEALGVKIH